MSRAAAREQAFKLLYQCEIMSAPPDEILETYTGLAGEDAAYPLLDQNDLDFLKQELFGAWEHKEEIDALIGRNTKDWKVNRLSRVLLAIMRIAVYEMCHQEDIPRLVSINEAIELDKQYDDEGTGAFVNGILGGVLRELEG